MMQTLVALIQQICWTSLVFSASSIGPGPVTAGVVFRSFDSPSLYKSKASLHFQVEFTPVTADQSLLCWLSLFPDPVLALGFPVPHRNDEVGLEMPLELMVTLCGACHVVSFQGGLLMKGQSTMLIPTERQNGGNIVQWHLVSKKLDTSTAERDRRLSYAEGLDMCEKRLKLKHFDFEALSTTRSILGWCKSVRTIFGDATYHFDDIEYTSLGNARRSTIELSEVNLGFQQFVTAGVKFSLASNHRKLIWKRDEDYRSNVIYASRTPVVLFDTSDEDRRAWLVMASDIILLVARHRISSGDAICETPESHGRSTKDSLLDVLHQDGTPSIQQFKSLACNIWSLLEYFRDDLTSRNQTNAVAEIDLRMRRETIPIPGLEYMDLVRNEGSASIKQARVKSTNGGWTHLVRDIDCLVLFGTGFGDVISPSTQSRRCLCSQWAAGVPKGHDYMATCTTTLLALYDKAGCKKSQSYLSLNSRLQWDRGKSSLFEECPNLSQECGCDRLQQIVRDKKVILPGSLHKAGAVIFGHSGKHSHHPTRQGSSSTAIYSHKNSNFSRYANSSENFPSESESELQMAQNSARMARYSIDDKEDEYNLPLSDGGEALEEHRNMSSDESEHVILARRTM